VGALVLGKQRLQNVDSESIVFAGTLSNRGLGHGRLKFRLCHKIITARYLSLDA